MILFWVQFAIFFCCNFVVWLFFSNFFSHYCNQFNVCLFIVDGAVVMIIVYWFVIFPEQTHMEFETDRATFFVSMAATLRMMIIFFLQILICKLINDVFFFCFIIITTKQFFHFGSIFFQSKKKQKKCQNLLILYIVNLSEQPCILNNNDLSLYTDYYVDTID